MCKVVDGNALPTIKANADKFLEKLQDELKLEKK